MARRSIFEGKKAARLIKRRKWRKDYVEQQIILKPSYRILNGLGMAKFLPSDPVDVKKKKICTYWGKKRGHDVRTAIVAKARRQLNADVLLPGSVQIAYQSNIAWTDADLTSFLKDGDSLRLGTFVTKVDCANRPFNA